MTAFPPSATRIPFLVVRTIMEYIATRPPNRTPDNEERKRYDVNQSRDALSAVLSWYLPTFWVIMYVMNFGELYVTLATVYPDLRSDFLLSILLPSTSLVTSLAFRLRTTPLFIFGTILASSGALLRLGCYRHLGRHFTFELALRKEHKLITDGPYTYVRHPSYLGSVTCFSGIFLCQFGSGSWFTEAGLWSVGLGRALGVLWVSYVAFMLLSMVFIRVPKEDLVLKTEFGKQWEQWAEKTPYRLFPGIY